MNINLPGHFILLLLLVWLTGSPVWAQGDATRRYLDAVGMVKRGQYEPAKQTLNDIIQRGGTLAPYAHYYYALATFRQRNFDASRLMLKQLMSRFSDWRKIDDAYYLYAANAMELGRYDDGLSTLQRISDPNFGKDVAKLEQYFMSRIRDLDKLKQLNGEFPENRSVALTLIDQLQRSGGKEDLQLSDRLTNRFGVPTPASSPSATPNPTQSSSTSAQKTSPANRSGRPTRPKNTYNVALMLPFRLDAFDSDRRMLSSQYVYDLYNGMKMAQAKLYSEGIALNLLAYDVENDPNKTLELINSPAFSQTDLIVGPLYAEPNRIASAYANQNNVLLLNPIATGGDLIADQPMSFLAQPSLERQATGVAEFMQSKGEPGNKRAAVYFGESRKDSSLALLYSNELKRRKFQVVDFQKLTGSALSMAEQMMPVTTRSTASVTATGSASSPPVSLNHIFLASNNDEDGPKLLDALSHRHVSGPVVASGSAFNYFKNSASTFTRRNLYLLYPEFIDTSRPIVETFEADYLATRNTIPSIFAMEGYDMLLFFGRQLARTGGKLTSRSGFRSDTDDYLLSGFDYTEGNDNQVVPIVKYEDRRFTKIN